MTSWYFPQEIWRQIKQYQLHLNYPEKKIKRLTTEMKYYIQVPFWLRLHQYKDFNYHYNYIKNNILTKDLWYIYSDDLICEKINNELCFCRNVYN